MKMTVSRRSAFSGNPCVRLGLLPVIVFDLIHPLCAEDLTIATPTSISQAITADNYYLNADVSLETGGSLTIQATKRMYIPGAADLCVTTTVNGGSIKWKDSNTSGYVWLGKYANGFGTIYVKSSGSYAIHYLQVDSECGPNPEGYIDPIRIGSGAIVSVAHWITSNEKAPTRVLFDGVGSYLNQRNYINEMFLAEKEGAMWVLEGRNGGDITLGIGSWWTTRPGQQILSAASTGKLKTQGDCNVCFFDHNINERRYFELAHSTNRLVWAHTGETIVSNGVVLKATADYALPNGPQTGRIVLAGPEDTDWNRKNTRPTLDICGTTQIVNGLYDKTSQAVGTLTNSSETAATLILDAGASDSEFRMGHVCPGITVRKAGSGSLTVKKTVLPKLVVDSGSVKIATADVVIEEMVVDGALLIVDGVQADIGRLSFANGGSFKFLNGGSLKPGCVVTGDLLIDTADYPAKWSAFDIVDYGYVGDFGTGMSVSLIKRTADTFTYYDNAADVADVDVRAGRLRIGGAEADAHYKFWRLTVRKTGGSVRRQSKDGTSVTNLTTALGRWWLAPASLNTSGPSLNGWLSMAEAGTPPAELAAGTWTSAKPWIPPDSGFQGTYAWQTPNVLGRPFYNGQYEYYYTTVFANQVPNPEDESTWERITVRLSDASAANYTIGGYLFAAQGGADDRCLPQSWTVEASNDGLDWKVMDVRDDIGKNAKGWWMNQGNMFLFSSLGAQWDFRPTGVVKVAANAILDLSEIPDTNVSIVKLEADMAAGAGAITKFVPAENGEIRLVNVSGELGRWTELYDVGSVVGEENLKGWTVYVNGSATKGFDVRVRDGKFCVHKLSGLLVIVK